ncbi:D-alanyl-D-alanine carboxypeptidase/D-alanyl-D-alanine-endopeptidase [Longivirga aurantiaca]|uniref:D-alanyl-D-alanine carboxypeptidase/D-alanyl-D-alanine-endopeptidase n=1 Tax=Longivirga aurantiaca TaxID=1837743 RepID=A0ABW1T3B1_9ACTN
MTRRLVAPVAVSAAALAALLLGALPANAEVPPDSGATTPPTSSVPLDGYDAYVAAQTRMAALLPARVAAARALGPAPGILVSDAGTGEVAYAAHSTTPMRGASTTKLLTAVTSLATLGTTTRFPTTVLDGRRATEVVLQGGGDPMLTSAQVSALARSTARALVPRAPAAGSATTFRVTVKVDDTLYPVPTPAVGWPSHYLPYVVAPVRPLIRDLRNSWDSAKDVGTYFAARLAVELKAALAARPDLAVSAAYSGKMAAADGAPVIARFAGNTSASALRLMLLVSDNDVAEMMLRNSAVAATGAGSWTAARSTARSTLNGLGIDTTGWVFDDGSGVSRTDRLTARGLVQLLRVAQSPVHPELAPLRGWLPVGGVSGTLKAANGRFTTSPTSCARGDVFAKTGTLFDTIGLAGYARGSDGRLKTFAVLVHRSGETYPKLTVRQSVDRVAATATGCY